MVMVEIHTQMLVGQTKGSREIFACKYSSATLEVWLVGERRTRGLRDQTSIKEHKLRNDFTYRVLVQHCDKGPDGYMGN
jgi:hypothetical protein